ncbi:DUF455 family protein [Streptomyces sp. GZWMJZ-114]|uniref:DUF455 family protein n=1 Tax=Streptomyces sp. GZWMJZ-114 TaxID=2494734 RepID=UPI0013E95424|nr:DUF455 family protein [Streptomyces sp. GZWMJZ-114]
MYSLINQSGLLRNRLLEMRVSENSLGGPSERAVTEAGKLVSGTSEEALAFAGGLLTELRDVFDHLIRSSDSESLYHDLRLYRDCRDLCQEGLDVAGRHALKLHFPEIPYEALYLSAADGQGTPTGTVDLDVPACPHRNYPHWAKFRAPRPKPTGDQAAVGRRNEAAGEAKFSTMDESSVIALLRIGFQIEFISTDVPLRNITNFPDMPLEFYLDMARHAHDEMRHTHLLVKEMDRLGHDAKETRMKRPDTYDAIADRPLDYRLIILSRTGEDSAIETFSDVIPKMREAGFTEAAAMFDHVLADELRHVAYANKWLNYLCAGDDAKVERLTTERIRLFNKVAEELGLGEDAIREPDHLADRASEADIELRALAGFSRRDLDKMAARR